MAGFNVGANAFLSSEFKLAQFAPNPVTERGSATVINVHPKEPKIIYCSGKFVVVKSLVDPNDCFVYRGHATTTTVAKFSPNGFWVASADSSGKCKVWAWDNPTHLTKMESQVLGGGITDLDWDSESKKIVAVGDGSGIIAKCFLWDTGNSAGEMVGHSKRILSVGFKQTRPFRIITGGEDMRTVFYQGPPFKMDHSNAVHTNFVQCVRFSSDGVYAVSVGSDKKIQFYDGKDGSPTGEIKDAHTGSIFAACFSPDNARLATASADKTIKVWNVAGKVCEQTISISEDPQVGDMQVGLLWSKDFFLSLSLNGDVNMLDPSFSTLKPVGVIQGHQGAVTSMFFNRETRTLFSGSLDGVIISRDLDSGRVIKVKGTDKKHILGACHTNKVTGIAVMDDELVSVGWDDQIRYASVASNLYNSAQSTNGQPIAIDSFAPSKTVAGITNKEIFAFQGQTKIAAFPVTFTPTCISMNRDAEVAVGGDDNKVHLFTLDKATDGTFAFNPCGLVEALRSVPTALAYSPSGT